MGDWLVWLLLGSFIVVLFCIYSLSSQVERCVHLAVEIITGNQRKILEQLEALNRNGNGALRPPNVLGFERREVQRRAAPVDHLGIPALDRRRSPGRRREDMRGS
jgi:hypothetical protein